MITVPTPVIRGMKEHALLPCLFNGLEEYVPQLTIERIAEDRHRVVHEEPALINTYIRECLKD